MLSIAFLLLLINFSNGQMLHFTSSMYNFSAEENVLSINAQVECTIEGGLSFNGEYQIVESGDLPFEINSTTGSMSLKSEETLDYEQDTGYSFDVKCSNGSANATAAVNFTILPVNEFLPDISDTSLTLTISELTPVGTVLVSTDNSGLRQLVVIDDDGGPDGVLRFLSSSNLSEFMLNETTGSLTLVQSIDLDSGSSGFLSLMYTIVVCDGDRPMEECLSVDVRIIVRAANDNPPVFEQDEYTLTMSETTPVGTNLTTVMCIDADRHGAGEFSGITVEPADAPVYIVNGIVFLNMTLNPNENVSVTLVCRDSGGLEDTATLLIIVSSSATVSTADSETTDVKSTTAPPSSTGLSQIEVILIGAVCAGVLLLFLILCILVCALCYCRRRRKLKHKASDGAEDTRLQDLNFLRSEEAMKNAYIEQPVESNVEPNSHGTEGTGERNRTFSEVGNINYIKSAKTDQDTADDFHQFNQEHAYSSVLPKHLRPKTSDNQSSPKENREQEQEAESSLNQPDTEAAVASNPQGSNDKRASNEVQNIHYVSVDGNRSKETIHEGTAALNGYDYASVLPKHLRKKGPSNEDSLEGNQPSDKDHERASDSETPTPAAASAVHDYC